MALIRAATNYRVEPLEAGWQLSEQRPGANPLPASPGALNSPDWTPALCPGTVASALRAERAWNWDSTQVFDSSDWWYRVRFSSAPCMPGEALWLELGGLATICDAWLNGTHILRSENMFCAHELDVSALVRVENEIHLRFSSLEAASSARRPRPRFKTRLIERQQLRWFRTTLLGRIPGWTPAVQAVGPWRSIRLTRRRALSIGQVELRSRIERGRSLVNARLTLDTLDARLESATLHVGEASVPLMLEGEGSMIIVGELEVPNAERWWPHSHGGQPRYDARIRLKTSRETHEVTFDPLAFRTVVAETDADRFALVVNDHEIRCRGACWTPADLVSLGDDRATVATVEQARAAGMNMLRVGGTMIYEADAFYEECERSGILIWQDFMFANCDYPADDQAFTTSVTREAEQFLSRVETRSSIAVLCGNSEVTQQIAMLGLPRESWNPPLFDDLLRRVSELRRPDVPFVPSTPSGGTLPFQPNAGLTHYYGVGAYLRPLEDARRAEVKFTPECLGFANIPEQATVEHVLGDTRAPFHDPRWKARVPRDSGPGWDFDDVRDHYTKLLFGVDPIALRYGDPDRALALGRVTTGEVMARTLAEWRRAASSCRGALIWFLRDLWPGAGWGLIDALGRPKAAYYYVQRAMQQQALFLMDEGLNGLVAHAINDAGESLSAELEVELLRHGSVRVAIGKTLLEIPGRGAVELNCSTLFEGFIDLTHAYRFGPAQYEVAIATLRDSQSHAITAEWCYFPGCLPAGRTEDLGLKAMAQQVAGDTWDLRLESKRFAYAISIDIPDFTPQSAYFELTPGRERVVRLSANVAGATPRGFVTALNAQSPTRVTIGACESNSHDA